MPPGTGGVLGGWQWQGSAYMKSTLCSGMGKREEKCDDWRSEDDWSLGKIERHC